MVTQIEIGDIDRGYLLLDISGNDQRLYSVGCPLFVGLILAGVRRTTKGRLQLVPKNRDGQPLESRAEALVIHRRRASPYPPLPRGTVDRRSIATVARDSRVQQLQDCQAIIVYLSSPPRRAT